MSGLACVGKFETLGCFDIYIQTYCDMYQSDPKLKQEYISNKLDSFRFRFKQPKEGSSLVLSRDALKKKQKMLGIHVCFKTLDASV